jgi:hypothetical protein
VGSFTATLNMTDYQYLFADDTANDSIQASVPAFRAAQAAKRNKRPGTPRSGRGRPRHSAVAPAPPARYSRGHDSRRRAAAGMDSLSGRALRAGGSAGPRLRFPRRPGGPRRHGRARG